MRIAHFAGISLLAISATLASADQPVAFEIPLHLGSPAPSELMLLSDDFSTTIYGNGASRRYLLAEGFPPQVQEELEVPGGMEPAFLLSPGGSFAVATIPNVVIVYQKGQGDADSHFEWELGTPKKFESDDVLVTEWDGLRRHLRLPSGEVLSQEQVVPLPDSTMISSDGRYITVQNAQGVQLSTYPGMDQILYIPTAPDRAPTWPHWQEPLDPELASISMNTSFSPADSAGEVRYLEIERSQTYLTGENHPIPVTAKTVNLYDLNRRRYMDASALRPDTHGEPDLTTEAEDSPENGTDAKDYFLSDWRTGERLGLITTTAEETPEAFVYTPHYISFYHSGVASFPEDDSYRVYFLGNLVEPWRVRQVLLAQDYSGPKNDVNADGVVDASDHVAGQALQPVLP